MCDLQWPFLATKDAGARKSCLLCVPCDSRFIISLGFQSRQNSGEICFIVGLFICLSQRKHFYEQHFLNSTLIQRIKMSVHHQDSELGMRSTASLHTINSFTRAKHCSAEITQVMLCSMSRHDVDFQDKIVLQWCERFLNVATLSCPSSLILNGQIKANLECFRLFCSLGW